MELQNLDSCPSLGSSSTELALAPLEPYVRRAMMAVAPRDTSCARSSPLFRPSPEPPTLAADRVNRVLVFSGCFNPPHKAHLQMLDYVFRHIGADLHVVAALVKFADEPACADKDRRRGLAPFVLSRRERLALWRGDPDARDRLDRVWPCPLDDRRYRAFARGLRAAARDDGFALDFIWLVGGHHVSAAEPPSHRNDAPEIVVTDFGRPVDFFHLSLGRPALDAIPGFARWDRLVVPRSRSVSASSSSSDEEPAEDTPPSHLVFECKRTLDDGWAATRSIRFVPGYAADLHTAHPRLNSSSIRRVIAGLPMDELPDVLRPHVLNLGRLMLYVRNKRMLTQARAVPTVPRDDEDSDVDIRTIIS